MAKGHIMAAIARISEVAAPDDHVVTAKEALESLYLRLEQEVDVRMLAAALRAGWSADEALDAIDELRKDDIKAASGR
jgi:chromosome segregation and condensation protein ScpB